MLLESLLSEAPLWNIGTVRSAAALRGGLTNQNYLITTTEGRFVLRLNNPNAELLGINREQELAVLKIIKGQSYAQQIAYYCPQFRYLISHYISGTSFAKEAPTTDENEQLLDIIYSYQKLPLAGEPVQYGNLLRKFYAGLAPENRLNEQLENDWRRFQPQLQQYEQSQWQPVLCHHDLNPANIIRSETGLTIIDWEYANNGHPYVDILHSNATNSQQELDNNSALVEIIYWLQLLWTLIRKQQR